MADRKCRFAFTWLVPKRKKADEENGCFKDEWMETFLFILPSGSSKPVCLICSKNTALT